MKIVQESIYFPPIGEVIDVTVCVATPSVGGHKLTAVFCDGEDFMEFITQNDYTEQILDNQIIDKAICVAQDEIRLDELIKFKHELFTARQRQVA